MLNFKILQTTWVRIAVVVAFSLICFAWLFGLELVLGSMPVEGEISAAAKTEYRLWKVATFLVANGTLLYVLLGRLNPGSEDRAYVRRLANGLAIGVAYADEAGVLCFANPSFFRYFGIGPSVIGEVAVQDLIREHGESVPAGDVLPSSGKLEYFIRRRLSGGSELDLLVVIQAEAGASEGYAVTVSDVSELRRLRAAQDLTTSALNALSYGLAICDLNVAGFPILYANATTARMSGFSTADLVGGPWQLLQGSDGAQLRVSQMQDALERGHATVASLRHVRRDSTVVFSEIEVTPVMDRSGRPMHAVCLLREITSKPGLLVTAWYDEITLLLSRAGFTHTLQDMLSAGSANHVLLVKSNIRHFHEFNTSLGWEAGDALLAEVGRRLSRSLPGAAVGRLTADQYALAIPIAPGEAEEKVNVVRYAIAGRYVIPGVTCDPLIALGYTVCRAGTTARVALQQSSVALKEACRDGRAGTRRFDEQMQRDILERRRLAGELQRAVQDRNFVVEFLPEVDLATGRIVAAEALVRWFHPLFGVQQPQGFIRLAEETGLILEIGELVLRQAIALAARINHDRQRPMVVTVNMSAAELRSPDIVPSIESALREHGAHPSWLQLDLAESSVAAAQEDILTSLGQLRVLGVGLGIDDFGAGHWPLNLLARFPVSKIKIAPWFIRGIEGTSSNYSLLKAVLDFGAAQDVSVVAEGVETEVERRALLRLGCTRGQGFLFSHAVSGPEFERLLAAGHMLTAPQTPALPLALLDHAANQAAATPKPAANYTQQRGPA